MELRALLSDDNAVSPVIGVILMVAITVILAAVIGAFVLGIGSGQEKAPQATFSFSYDNGDGAWDAGDDDKITIEHDGGETVDNSTLEFKVGGNGVGSADTGPNWDSSVSSWSAGTTATMTESTGTGDVIGSGDTVNIVWTASSGDSTQILAEGTVP